jgi:hypothetical protein
MLVALKANHSQKQRNNAKTKRKGMNSVSFSGRDEDIAI